MKQLITILAASAAISGSLLAGHQTIEAKMSAPAEEFYGIGWYGAIDGGVNAYQNLGSNRVIHRGDHTITLSPDENVGGFGGIKLGYVFGTGFVRPALEADLFYNGIDVGVNVDVDGDHKGRASGRIDSGAFMANSLLRFNFERFQPYFGFGLGYYVAQGNDLSVDIRGESRARESTNSQGGLAWQIVAGGDYYFNPKFSAFLEYKFLNYSDIILNHTAEQQLVGLGLRFHF